MNYKKCEKILKKKDGKIKSQQQELESRPTKEEFQNIKTKLKELQALKFNLIEENDSETNQEKSLEMLLIEKNRRLEDEITKIKLQLQDTKALLEQTKQEQAKNSSLVNDQKKTY